MTTLNKNKSDIKTYFKVFAIAFIIFAVILIPLLIFNEGYMIYYGDFNSQQIPFYKLAHTAVKSGEIFWDWNTDLGANFIGSYSFYLLGSPFFWFSLIFPTAIITYIMPLLLCMKYAVAAVTAYAYIRRFIKNDNNAFIGALLYAFSGFQAYNVFFNHFHDVTAFFPLLLIALEERVVNNRRGVFALAVALMAVLNYFFFTGQVVFVLIYFILRCFCKDFNMTWKKFFSIAVEAVIGVMISAAVLLPSCLAILGNSRVDERLYGLDMVSYYDRTKVWRIIQSFFMLPDIPARPNLFDSEYSKWASIAGYLPLFSMAGVLSFMKAKSSHWCSVLIKICAVCAVIPILNSAFYMFNSSYYARWFYMPTLIMAMMTVYALESKDIKLTHGNIICGIFLAGMAIIAILPTKSGDKVSYFKFPDDIPKFWAFWLTSAICLLFCIIISRRKNQDKPFLKYTYKATIAFCLACTAVMFYFGVAIGPYPHTYANEALEKGGEIVLEEEPEQFFRVDISENCDNYPMLWGYSSMRAFHSIVPVSIMDFYDSIGIERDVASRPEVKYYTLRGLYSVKYYIQNIDDYKKDKDGNAIKELDMPGFEYLETQNNFDIYINNNYIPMGFTYDYCISQEKYDTMTKPERERALIKAIVLNAEQENKYKDIIESAQLSELDVPKGGFEAECKERASESASSFIYNSKGFTAEIELEKDNLVFFSVPFEKGWSAEVNGTKAQIERVSGGFMAVKADAGANTIRFSYKTDGLDSGIVITAAGLVLFAAYIAFGRLTGSEKKKAQNDAQTEE